MFTTNNRGKKMRKIDEKLSYHNKCIKELTKEHELNGFKFKYKALKVHEENSQTFMLLYNCVVTNFKTQNYLFYIIF